MDKGYALVTGALGGLGTAITKGLLNNGYDVVACDRRGDDHEAWLDQFSFQEKDRLRFDAFDIRNLGAVESYRTQLEEDGIHVAYLVNNAGIASFGSPWEMDPQSFDRVVQVNLYGTFHLTRTFIESMKDDGFGRIVNFASAAGYVPDTGMAPYSAAKLGVVGYTHSIALDLAQFGITANVIAPGLIWHDRLKDNPAYTDEERTKFRSRVPMKREGVPTEIADTVAFLLSDGAGYITGQTLHVNGGLYMT